MATLQPPQISLQPGSTNTAAVKQLQDWLVANNYMTQAQVNTGYGIYGPQTTAAVQSLQQKLGVDNSTGPGYWGPRTLEKVNTVGTAVQQPSITSTASAPTSTPTSSTTSSPQTSSNTSSPQTMKAGTQVGTYKDQGTGLNIPVYFDGKNLTSSPTGGSVIAYLQDPNPSAGLGTGWYNGGRQAQEALAAYANFSTPKATVGNQYAMTSAAVDIAKQNASLGQTTDSFNKALEAAKKDQNIVAKYADMAKLDSQAFTQQLEQAQQQYGTQAQQQRMQFEQERKGLAEQQAAAGTAYSGFRGKAQANLAQMESGIVQSSRSQQQQTLNQLTSQFEQKYGSEATPQASLSLMNPLTGNTSISGLNIQANNGTETLTGVKAGGITGTVAPAKQADINQQATYNYQTAQYPQTA